MIQAGDTVRTVDTGSTFAWPDEYVHARADKWGQIGTVLQVESDGRHSVYKISFKQLGTAYYESHELQEVTDMADPIFIEASQAAGHKVEKVIFDYSSEVFIKFTDGSVLGFIREVGQYGESDSLRYAAAKDLCEVDRLGLGYMTAEEFAAHREADDRKRAGEARELRRRQWESLDREFGGKR